MFMLMGEVRRVNGQDHQNQTYRLSSRWPIRFFVIFSGLIGVGQAVAHPPGDLNVGLAIVLIVLAGLVTSVLLSLWIWNEKAGVHTTSEGLTTTGAHGSRFASWRSINHFVLTRRGLQWTIVAILEDGVPIRLTVNGWPWQKGGVEAIKCALDVELAGSRS